MKEPMSNITVQVPTHIKRKLEQMAADHGHKKMVSFLRKELEKMTAGVELKGPGEYIPKKDFVIPESEKSTYPKQIRINKSQEPAEVKDRDYSGEIDPSVLSTIGTKWANAFK